MLFPIVGYFIWTGDPRLFSLGSISIKWNAVLLILGFLICRQILFYIFSQEKKPLNEASKLSIYLVLSALISSRLGYLIFYEPKSLWQKALTIVFPFEFEPAFNILSPDEFSVHGAVIGILVFLFLYKRKNRLHQNYLQVLDRVTIPAAVSGIFLLASSFLHSDTIGKQTSSSSGTVFIQPVVNGLLKVPCCIMRSPDGLNPLERVIVKKDSPASKSNMRHQPVILYLFFKPGPSEQLVNEFLVGDVKTYLYDMSRFVLEPGTQPLQYRIFLDTNGQYIARVKTLGIVRYPVQIFEAVTLLILAGFLFWWFVKFKTRLQPGRLFGIFMLVYWTARFLFQYLKESDSASLAGVGIQISSFLNILFMVIGLIALIISLRKIPAVLAR